MGGRERASTTGASEPDREELVRGALPIVGYCVTSIAARVPRHVPHDDLVSAGMFGLAQAAKSWDPARGVPFRHFARRRIEGALLDELRSRDWASRSVREGTRRLQSVTEQLTNRFGRAPSDAEVAQALGLTVDEVTEIREDVRKSVVLHLDGFEAGSGATERLAAPTGTDPVDDLLGRELCGYLRDAVDTLPERLRKVVVEYFLDERPMKEIADEMGVTISRVSQLRAEAIRLLRDGITAQFDDRPAARTAPHKADYYAAIASASDFATRLSGPVPASNAAATLAAS